MLALLQRFSSIRRAAFCLLFAMPFLLTACATAPAKTDNICAIFKEKKRWYKPASSAAKRWNSQVPVMMAIMHQESRFRHNVRPPRKKYLGFIPGPRPSNAMGYSQALKSTWRAYQKDTGRRRADRTRFSDAIDFVGWYNSQSRQKSSIASDDAYNLYLAYHEGHGGFNRRTYNNKKWLTGVAAKVAGRAKTYSVQLAQCEKSLQKKRWFFGLF